MQKYLTMIFSALLLIMVISIAVSDEKFSEFPLKSTAAHESSTGAPGERTCAQSGCHETSEVYNDDTTNALLFTDGDQTYTDKMEGITLRVRKKNCEKFGFQIVCLDTLKRNVGSWVLLNKERVQLQSSDFSVPAAAGRKYITHTYKGTVPQNVGEISWDFSWLPPLNGYKGKVTFYVMSNCTNNDNKSSGDALYASQHSLSYNANTSSEPTDSDNDIIAFHVGNGIWTLPMNNYEQIKHMMFFDMNGKSIPYSWQLKNDREVEILTNNPDFIGLLMIAIEFESGKTLKKAVFFHS